MGHRTIPPMNAYSLQGASPPFVVARPGRDGPSCPKGGDEPVGMEEMASDFLRRHERGEVRTETVDGPST